MEKINEGIIGKTLVISFTALILFAIVSTYKDNQVRKKARKITDEILPKFMDLIEKNKAVVGRKLFGIGKNLYDKLIKFDKDIIDCTGNLPREHEWEKLKEPHIYPHLFEKYIKFYIYKNILIRQGRQSANQKSGFFIATSHWGAPWNFEDLEYPGHTYGHFISAGVYKKLEKEGKSEEEADIYLEKEINKLQKILTESEKNVEIIMSPLFNEIIKMIDTIVKDNMVR